MKPAWSLILLTTLIGTGQGLFLVVYLVNALRSAPQAFVRLGGVVSLAFLVAGLVALLFRIGQLARARRAVTQWRTSWLWREVIVLPASMAFVAWYAWSCSLVAGAIAALLCLILFICTGMIHASPVRLQKRATFLALLNFTLLCIASGFTLSVPIAVVAYAQFAGPLALAAFGLGALAWLVRCATLVRGERPASAAAGAPGVTRWFFVALFFPLPGWLLGWGGGSLEVFWAAFALQFAGLLAERWTYFAEARHPQSAYDQSTV